MKKCPYCAEMIQDEAIKCRYCGSAIGMVSPVQQKPEFREVALVRQPPPPAGLIVRFFRFLASEMVATQYGRINSKVHCERCHEVGHVRLKRVRRKKGLSGGKVVGALFTGGVSILATGLSRKEGLTQARCDNCMAQWDF